MFSFCVQQGKNVTSTITASPSWRQFLTHTSTRFFNILFLSLFFLFYYFFFFFFFFFTPLFYTHTLTVNSLFQPHFPFPSSSHTVSNQGIHTHTHRLDTWPPPFLSLSQTHTHILLLVSSACEPPSSWGWLTHTACFSKTHSNFLWDTFLVILDSFSL